MQPQSRLGDQSTVPVDEHGKLCCPHPCIGPAITGSPDVYVNMMPALRVTDTGIHAACCGPNTWIAQEGSNVVLINMLPAHRLFDLDIHCGGPGFMVEASEDVYIGDCTETGLAQAKIFTQALVPTGGGLNVQAVPFQPDQVQVIPGPPPDDGTPA